MTQLREFMTGSRDRFAIRLGFQRDPDRGIGASPEESLSWGYFEIWVRGQNLCAQIDNGEPISAVHWYLLPMLEWFVEHWRFIFHEERLPIRAAANDARSSWREPNEAELFGYDESSKSSDIDKQDWWSRHNLMSCRQGGLYPDVFIRRWRESVEISWGPVRTAGAPENVSFTSGAGFSRHDPEEVADAVFDVLQMASSHLVEQAPQPERFLRLQTSLRNLKDGDVNEYAAVLAGLGADGEQMISNWASIQRSSTIECDERQQREIFGSSDRGIILRTAPLAARIFATLSPATRTEDCETILRSLRSAYTREPISSTLWRLGAAQK